MKKSIYLLATFLLPALVLSCAKEQIPVEEEVEGIEMTYSVCTDIPAASAKTTLTAGTKVSWTLGENVAMVYYRSSRSFVRSFTVSSLLNEDGTSAEITGSAISGAVAMGAYPYNTGLSYDGVNTLKGISIPAEQTAVAGSFAEGLNPAVAREDDMVFKNVGALVEFNVAETDITAVTLTANEDLVGTADVVYEKGGSPAVTITSGSKSVRLSGEFAVGKKYYFVVYPGTYTGLKLTFEREGLKADLNTSYKLSLARNSFVQMKTIAVPGLKWYATDCKPWNDFNTGSTENVLHDFSYAGYDHGESVPGNVYGLGYRIYNIADYGAIPNDGQSDRQAFIDMLADAVEIDDAKCDEYNVVTKPVIAANVILYFPAGEWILHDENDNENNHTKQINIRCGNIVLKGAGRDNTRILMESPLLPKNDELYSSPTLLSFYHYSNITNPVSVTAVSDKGSHEVTVANGTAFTPGQWVCVKAEITDLNYIKNEMGNLAYKADWTDILAKTTICEYHQVKSISGNVLTLYEPLYHELSATDFAVYNYAHYENIGVEDITFVGHSPADLEHHRSYIDDGGYKPLNFMRTTNSWVRRCGFESCSEGLTIHTSANCSAYDNIVYGFGGHAPIRAANSTSIFIGGSSDVTTRTYVTNAGNYHGFGVNGTDAGCVFWRLDNGNNNCFESHASQPRASLFDCITGSFMQGDSKHTFWGGGKQALPHHLKDLTIWNWNSTATYYTNGAWSFWGNNTYMVKPVVVGFHGDACTFDESTMTLNYSNGTPVQPESLYEAQLHRRLGYLPAWVNELKAKKGGSHSGEGYENPDDYSDYIIWE